MSVREPHCGGVVRDPARQQDSVLPLQLESESAAVGRCVELQLRREELASEMHQGPELRGGRPVEPNLALQVRDREMHRGRLSRPPAERTGPLEGFSQGSFYEPRLVRETTERP